MKIPLHISLCLLSVSAGCNRNISYGGVEPGETTSPVEVFEYTPAPGQFIGDATLFPDEITDPGQACEYAQGRLALGRLVSLGGFGGYIVVGLGESIPNSDGGYDFSVTGNQLDSSSEPGIVWVMRDGNGDGKPNEDPDEDEIWYELKGSETGKTGTIQKYWVQYFRPADEEDVPWTDSEGESGFVPRNAVHTQPSYYPAWISGDSYTLHGTRLESRCSYDEVLNLWVNERYDWGYADNMGDDSGARADAGEDDPGGDRRKVCFKISNAIDAAGDPVHLDAIDFIKVQTAVNAVGGGNLGELSTEVCAFAIEN